ncbi:hypothetical protein C2S51_001761 [Perilla frutescens var. frutescens]|nr:hypothetical protein C2S51_001761 [Perilla frutescens var. frutescens]
MKMSFNSIIILIFILNLHPSPLHANDTSDLETYIVHVEAPDDALLSSHESDGLESWYHSFLPTTTTSTAVGDRIVYSYNSVFKGFAARLSPQEVRAMESKDGFISAKPEAKLSLHTTHSPNFLGLNQNKGFWRSSNYGKGVIIGLLDTGISPNHPSFSDEGMPPPPAKWKGRCEFNGSTSCNNKIIGARYFGKVDGETPIDNSGHGTHTSSTAAGNFVKGANFFGSAKGTASGIAPLAHIAMYRVCSPSCDESQILAAMDAAIDDGVDILSLSLGGFPDHFYADNIAVGAFSAMQKGIFVSCSAGNSGPFRVSLSNTAPWILTVGASTIDRSITATAVLGNNQTFDGQSLFQPRNFPTKMVPLVYPSEFGLPCTSDTLEKADIRGKIAVCQMGAVLRADQGAAVKEAGGAGMILPNLPQYAYMTFPEADSLPASHVSFDAGLKIKDYYLNSNSTSTPMAKILFKGTVMGDGHAPAIAAFSSRGPSEVTPGILKPDILGPGVNILAAWPFSIENKTNTKSTFKIVSGTSMSCPHLSGVAALLRSKHPDWSPAVIKSAMLTTADVVNRGRRPITDEAFNPADIFATGSGHVNPSRADDPGLVYDIKPEDYIPYLCGLNYTNQEIGLIVQHKVNCSAEASIPEAQLNYPSFSLMINPLRPSYHTYSRTVTNVGEPKSSYIVEIVPPPGFLVVVRPTMLYFSNVHQKLHYNVTFSRPAKASNSSVVQGFLKWNSSRHSVRSPIAVILTEKEF